MSIRETHKIIKCDWIMPEKEIVNIMIDNGPGYRVYCHLSKVIFLMWGGTKGTQTRDILAARRILDDAKKRLGGSR
jgi:putative addiction module killer protein